MVDYIPHVRVYKKKSLELHITCPVHLTTLQYNQDIRLSGLQKSS